MKKLLVKLKSVQPTSADFKENLRRRIEAQSRYQALTVKHSSSSLDRRRVYDLNRLEDQKRK